MQQLKRQIKPFLLLSGVFYTPLWWLKCLAMSVFFLYSLKSFAQGGVFFKDSGKKGYYDSGLAFFTAPSVLKQAPPDKIPTITTQAKEGSNSLEITWTSASGGDWSALVIAPGFPFQDITQKKYLFFWAYSPALIAANDLPNILFEGAPSNAKSKKYPLSQFLPKGLPAATWTPVSIPLSTFFNDPNKTKMRFSETKAVIFGQRNADNVTHTLFIDYVFASNSNPLATPLVPQAIRATGYGRHVELRWKPLADTKINVVEVYRASGNSGFSKVGQTRDSIYIDYTGKTGRNTKFTYKLRVRLLTGTTSNFTAPVSATTQDMTDEELLTMVQRYTFRYFWEFAHPVSGLAYERNTSVGNQVVTSGGSGFGIMAIPVAIERGFISRQQGIARIVKIVNFLSKADRFHGVWSHWLNGSTGKVIPFSQKDNGGDIVETAFLMQGLITAQQYFDRNNTEEKAIRDKITTLWRSVEWSWYRKIPTNSYLFWHWSPSHGWDMNHALRGWNEVMITYILGIASPTYPIPVSLYATGWARSGAIKNGTSPLGIRLPLGSGHGGPLFFTHYSYLGFDPRGYQDRYTAPHDYFTQGKAQTLINRAYCINNPGKYKGYGKDCWGLTASDDPLVGYMAHEPNIQKDNGTITPTAALSSMPYTPQESLAALKYFYREEGKRLWGVMGFYDAFNLSQDWFASSYLAIDQGPIVLMIENHRSKLLWHTFMKSEYIQSAIQRINTITSVAQTARAARDMQLYPNPTQGATVSVRLPIQAHIEAIYAINGTHFMPNVVSRAAKKTYQEVILNIEKMPPGIYLLQAGIKGKQIAKKLIVR